MKAKFTLLKAVRCAAVAALYFCLTWLLSPISFGTMQIRLSEALTLLPALFPEAAIGLAVGCALSNLSSPFGLLDVIFGAAVTLIAGILTSKIKNIFLAALPPILLNAALMPLVWYMAGSTDMYIISALSLLVSQSVVVYAGGVSLVRALKRIKVKDKEKAE